MGAPNHPQTPDGHMLGIDSDSYVIGAGYNSVVPASTPVQRRKNREFIASGPGWMNPKDYHSLTDSLDELVRAFGPRVYQAMLTDPTVKSAVGSIKLGILDGGLSLTSPVKFPAWTKQTKVKPRFKKDGGGKGDKGGGGKPGPGGQDSGGADALEPDQQAAKEILEFCQRSMARLDDLGDQLFSLLNAMAFGVKLAEVTCAVPKEGVDKGKLVLDSLKVRPNWAWRFLVDAYMNVRGILTWNPQGGTYEVVDPSKFAWLSWMPEDSDPRGSSILRAAYMAWNLKIQSWPMYYQHLVRFGSPGVDVEMAENDTIERQPLDDDGNEIPEGQADPVSAETYMTQAVRLYRNGGSLIHPAGSKVKVFEPNSDGQAFRMAVELFDRQICLAIEMQARATLEAKNGSKADSETAQDTKGLVNSYGRRAIAQVFHRVLRQLVRDNFGGEAAERFTPVVTAGESDKQDKPAMLAALGSVGYTLAPSQMQEVDAMADMPVRDPDEDARAADEAMQRQQATEGAPGTPGREGSKPPAKANPGAPKPAPGKPEK